MLLTLGLIAVFPFGCRPTRWMRRFDVWQISADDAIELMRSVEQTNVKLMFDTLHASKLR
jgi:hypothetical protein